MAPPPCEACASGQRVPPPPGVACRARRGIVTNRVRRAAAAAVKSLPMPPWGEACHPCTRQGVPPPPGDARRRHQRCSGVPPPAHSLSARFQATARLVCRPQCESDQHFSVCWIIVAAISSLGTRGPAAGRGVRCRAQRAAATRHGVPCEAWHPGSIPANRMPAVPQQQPCEECRCRRGARRDVHAPGQACRRHRATRGARHQNLLWCTAAGAQFVRSFSSNWSFKGSTQHHLLGHCQLVEY